MESFIHADIFFFITSIVAIVLGIVGSIILIYVAIILADIREISRIARKESADIAEDVRMIRNEIKEELMKGTSTIVSVVKVFGNLFKMRKSRIINKKNEK